MDGFRPACFKKTIVVNSNVAMYLGETHFGVSLGEVPSTVHLKMKYHMSKSEVVMLRADLMGARRCDKALQRNLTLQPSRKGSSEESNS